MRNSVLTRTLERLFLVAGTHMTRVLQTRIEALVYVQQALQGLRDIAVTNQFETLAYIIERAHFEAAEEVRTMASRARPQ